MNYNIYKVEKVDNYINTADTLDYDYAKDFEYLKAYRGYAIQDYVISDSEFELGQVYFDGDLIKPIAKVASFGGEPATIIVAMKNNE